MAIRFPNGKTGWEMKQEKSEAPSDEVMQISGEACGNCRFFKPSLGAGHCYRYPPSIQVPAIGHAYVGPTVRPTQWCGEYAKALV